MDKHNQTVQVNGWAIPTDSEGYLQNLDDWSEVFAYALAEQKGLVLTDRHWEVIQFLRTYFHEHDVQAQVRIMVKHFSEKWGAEPGSTGICMTCSLEAAPRSRATAWPDCCAPRANTEGHGSRT